MLRFGSQQFVSFHVTVSNVSRRRSGRNGGGEINVSARGERAGPRAFRGMVPGRPRGMERAAGEVRLPACPVVDPGVGDLGPARLPVSGTRDPAGVVGI